jgi:PPK2 family polyphosphate:nucleotide phosphotransferase
MQVHMAKDESCGALRVKPRSKVRLRDWETAWAGTKELRHLKGDQLEQEARGILQRNLQQLADAQALLWASDKYALLVVLQGMDAAGKDGLIKHVMSGVNPQGCQVFSFKQPTDEELQHNFLWRHAKCLPARGRIGIFNRSYYEDVLVVRVHPEWLAKQDLKSGRSLWHDRYEDINCFERHLARNRTVILKFFLHVSKKEQKRRLLERLENADKHWKFSAADLAERGYWDDYVDAYEDALSATSTRYAPWYIIPADHKWIARALVSEILTTAIQDLHLKFPKPTTEQLAAIRKAKRQLM